MSDKTKAKTEIKPWKKWHKRLLLGLGVFIFLIIALGSLAPKTPEPDNIKLLPGPRPIAEVRYEINGAWNDADYLRQIR